MVPGDKLPLRDGLFKIAFEDGSGFPNGIYFLSRRGTSRSPLRNRHGAIKRRDPASLPIYFTSSIEICLADAGPRDRVRPVWIEVIGAVAHAATIMP